MIIQTEGKGVTRGKQTSHSYSILSEQCPNKTALPDGCSHSALIIFTFYTNWCKHEQAMCCEAQLAAQLDRRFQWWPINPAN